MTQDPKRAIVAADRLSDGIIIEFDDGRCGIFDVETLYTCFPVSATYPSARWDGKGEKTPSRECADPGAPA